MLEQIVALKNP